MLFKEIIPVSLENHKKPINTLCGQNANLVFSFGSLVNDAFSVTRLYSVDDRVTSE
jgi:hypothetical protein